MKRMFQLIALSFICISDFSQRNVQRPSSITFNPNSGYFNTTEIIPAIGLSNTDFPYSGYYIGIINISGYQISFKNSTVNRKLHAGLGTGVMFYNEGTLFPLFLDFRFILNEKTITPFVFASGGGLIHFRDFNEQSRIFVSPGIGARYTISESLAAHVGAGVLIQSGSPGRDAFLNFRLGLSFKP